MALRAVYRRAAVRSIPFWTFGPSGRPNPYLALRLTPMPAPCRPAATGLGKDAQAMKEETSSARRQGVVLVANPVLGDARVRKGAFALSRTTLRAVVVGYGSRGRTDATVEGLPLEVVERPVLVGAVLEEAKRRVPSATTGGKEKRWHWAPSVSLIARRILLLKAREYGTSIGYRFVAWQLSRHVARMRPTLIHAHDIVALLAALRCKRNDPRLRVVWDAHELYTELEYKSPAMSRYIDRFLKRAAPSVDGFVTINRSIADLYAKRYPALPPATIVMNATRRTATDFSDDGRLRQAAGVSQAQKVLLFQGGLSRGRGIDAMLEAAATLPQEWTMVFMGNGAMEAAIEEAARRLNPARPEGSPVIARIGPAPYDELAHWTAGADLGAIPYENTSLNHLYCTPNKLWEYPNAGVPILATDLEEMGTFVRKHGIGVLLPRTFTGADIVQALERVSDAELNAMRQACDRFNEVENWECYEPRLLELYRSLGVEGMGEAAEPVGKAP